jgi:hypothetical protein
MAGKEETPGSRRTTIDATEVVERRLDAHGRAIALVTAFAGRDWASFAPVMSEACADDEVAGDTLFALAKVALAALERLAEPHVVLDGASVQRVLQELALEGTRRLVCSDRGPTSPDAG